MGELRGVQTTERTQSDCILLGCIFEPTAVKFVDTRLKQDMTPKQKLTTPNKFLFKLRLTNNLTNEPSFPCRRF